jgi:capsid protein
MDEMAPGAKPEAVLARLRSPAGFSRTGLERIEESGRRAEAASRNTSSDAVALHSGATSRSTIRNYLNDKSLFRTTSFLLVSTSSRKVLVL